VTGRIRRGSALILVLIMTLALAALSMSAIYMAGGSGLLVRYHDKERDLGFALETALELGKSRLQRDTTLVLYDTGYKQLLTSQAVYTSDGTPLTGVSVDLYGAYTGDTSGTYVPYVTLLATVTDAGTVRLARRMDLVTQSFARYALFTNDFPSSASIGAGENIPGRVHSNSRFTASGSGSPSPVFADTVSAAGTISGSGQWSDTVSATGGARVIPYPAATVQRAYFLARANAGDLDYSVQAGSAPSSFSGGQNVSGAAGGTAIYSGRVEFLTIDVNNNGMIDSTEGFMKVFEEWSGYGADTARLTTNFSGNPVLSTTHVMRNQCGAFYTLLNPTNGRVQREFFPVSMHSVTWVRNRIQGSTYPTVSSGQAANMAANNSAAVRAILGQPTARCFPVGSPYLMNVERFTTNGSCQQDYFYYSYPTMYTWGSAFACASTDQYGGQDSTFTHYIFTCVVDVSSTSGRCTPATGSSTYYDPAYVGAWTAYSGSSSLPSLSGVRQNVERPYLWPLSKTYNPNSRGVVFLSTGSSIRRSIFMSGTVRGNVTVYADGVAVLIDDLTYDTTPADTSNLCRNLFGLIARDSVMVSDNAMNRPRIYDTPATNAGYTLMMGGNRDFLFHGVAMALGGSVNTFNPNVATATTPAFTCPTGSAFTAAGGCLKIVGGAVMKSYAAPYTGTANSGLRPLREADPCLATTNRRPPYFPLAPTRLRALKSFDVDLRQVKSSSQIRSYYALLRGTRAAP